MSEIVNDQQRLVRMEAMLGVINDRLSTVESTGHATLERVTAVQDTLSVHGDLLRKLALDRSREVWTLRGLLATLAIIALLKVIF